MKKVTRARGQFVSLEQEVNHFIGATLEVVASTGTFTAQVHWDEGFTAPTATGRHGEDAHAR